MDNTGSSETSENVYPTTRYQMTVGRDRQNQQKEDKYYMNE